MNVTTVEIILRGIQILFEQAAEGNEVAIELLTHLNTRFQSIDERIQVFRSHNLDDQLDIMSSP